jgi:hypothetical protein
MIKFLCKFAFVVMLIPMILLTSCVQSNTSSKDAIIFDLSKDSKIFTGNVKKSNEGLKFASKTEEMKITLKDKQLLDVDADEYGIFKVNLINTGENRTIKIDFITEDDKVYNSTKSVNLNINNSEKAQEYTIDFSGKYGWNGKVIGVSLSTPAFDKGEITICSITFEKEGTNYSPIKIGKKETVYSVDDRFNLGLPIFPDGVLGMVKNKDGTIDFYGSSSGKLTKTNGSIDNPFEKVIYKSSLISNQSYDYASIAQVYTDKETNILIGLTHLETHFYVSGGELYYAKLGISYSEDNGNSWTFAGEIVEPELPYNENSTSSLDVGNGSFIVKDNFFYLYYTDAGANKTGLSVARAPVDEVVNAARKGTVSKWNKYYNGKFAEKGIGGKFSSILAPNEVPNFMHITFNKTLNKYLMVRTIAPFYSVNGGDLVINISDNLLDFNTPNIYLDCGERYQQYPTIISNEDDPQQFSGKSFYIYYCDFGPVPEIQGKDWLTFWNSCNYVRREITVK